MLNQKSNPRLFDQQAQNFTSNRNFTQRKKNAVSIVKLVGIVVVVVFLFGILIRIPGIFNRLVNPFEKVQSNIYQNTEINLDNRTNILVISHDSGRLEETALMSYQTGTKKVQVVLIPGNLVFAGEESSYPVNELLKFNSGEVSQIDRLTAALVTNLGYPIDGYLAVNFSKSWLTKENLDEIISDLYTPGFLLSVKAKKDFLDQNLQTNLTLNQLYQLTQTIKTLRPERFEVSDLAGFLTAEQTLDTAAFKNLLDVKLSDSKIAEENATLEIVNSSGVHGYATIIKNIASNLGTNVIETSATEDTSGQSQILIKSDDSILGQRLQKLLKIEKIGQLESSNQIDIKVIIGQDFAKLYQY